MKKYKSQPTHRPSQAQAKPDLAKGFWPKIGLSPAVRAQRANMHASARSSALHRFWSQMRELRSTLDFVLLVGLAGMSFLAVAPDKWLMPTSFQMWLLAAVLVLLAGFLALLWREHPTDEREVFNQALASRTAYTVGSCVLIVALIVQSLQHNLDAVVPVALLAMIATKILIQHFRD